MLVVKLTTIQSQTTLLKNQVYNFNEGDIFMTASTQASSFGGGRTDYRLDTIKTIITNTTDTFKYVTSFLIFYRDFSFPINSFAGHTSFKETLIILGLDSVANHKDTWCAVKTDTIRNDSLFCNALTWAKTSEPSDPNCRYKSYLIEGCGGPYYDITVINPENGEGMVSSYSLVYFKKSNNECGHIITSSEEIADLKSLKVYPNPADKFISLDGVSLNSELTIYHIDGRKNQTIRYNGQPINVEDLYEGVYFLQAVSKNKGNPILKFIKQ